MLIPREHGAYGQIGFPIAASMAAGRPSLAAVVLTAGLVAAFVAHESLLVLLGVRGPRVRREQRKAALRDGTWLGLIALVGVSIGSVLMPAADRWVVLVPAVCAAGIVALALQHVEKTTAGEMFVAFSAASCAVPVGAASGVSLRASVLIWVVMTLGYWAATAAVRGTIAKQRRQPHRVLRIDGAVLSLAGGPSVLVMAQALGLPAVVWVATVPLSVLSLVLAVVAPHARHLRRIGWSLIAASGLAAVLLAVLLRV